MSIIFFLVVFSDLLNEICSIHNPFTTVNDGLFYTSSYSEKNTQKIISINTIDESNFSINIGGKYLNNFNLAKKNDDMSVKIFVNSYNPSLRIVSGNIKIKVLCEFSYPITVVGTNDAYKCSIFYKEKSGQNHLIGKCSLILQYKSSFCIISGFVSKDHLSNNHKVKIFATIYHCNAQCLKHVDLDWKGIVHNYLILPLVSFDHILWMKAFYKQSLDIGILVGIPKNPINKSTFFEIPLKLKRSEKNNKITNIALHVIHSDYVVIEEVISVGCFQSYEPKPFGEKNMTNTEIEITKEGKVQCSKTEPDLLCILLISVKEEVNHLSMKITIVDLILENKSYKFNKSQDTDIEQLVVTTPLFQGQHFIIPVIKNPIILPTLERLNNAFTFQPSDIRIYYIYDETKFIDVSAKVKCRPYDKTRLKCPSTMITLTPVLWSLEYSEAIKWSLEMLIDETFVVVTVQPLSQPADNWNLTLTDSVLNMISGWRSPKRRGDSSLITEVKCEPIYQISLINIYKKMSFFDKENNQILEILVDMSERLNRSNIRISNKKANIFVVGKAFIIQGIQYGDLDVELISVDKLGLVRSYMTVLNEPVSVTDLHVSCISDINIIKKVIFSSSIITIADFNFKFKNLNNLQNCFFIIDVIFSDQIKTNLILFPKDQYSLRFITNTKIIEVYDLENMWYDFKNFNNQRSFYVELQESKFCDSPKTISKKYIILNDTSFSSSTYSIPKTEPINVNTSQFLLPFSTTKESSPNVKTEIMDTKSLKWIIFILIGVVLLVLIIVITNIILKCKNKNSLIFRNRRRKSLNVIEIHNTLKSEKDYPPLLPPPGPQVQLSDSTTVAISSPHSFWCGEPNNVKSSSRVNPFFRQGSLPMKGYTTRGYNEIAPCPPLRWINKIVNGTSTINSYNSQERLNIDISQDLPSFSPMTWSITNMDVDESSGVGSLNTNIDDIIKDSYGSKERFHKLVELPCSNSNKKERIYDII